MKITFIISSILGIALSIFGYWGLKTESGQRKFDEMAGMIPFGALVLGVIFLIVAVIFALIVFTKK